MLEYFLTVDKQILSMVLMVVTGYWMYHKGIMTDRGLTDLSQILLKIVTPMVLLKSFQREFSLDLFGEWLKALGVMALSYLVLILVAYLFYRNREENHCGENRISIVFSNNGYMAIPLMLALAGEKGVFLGSTNIILLNILFWTYGIKMLKAGAPLSLKQILLNPGVIAVVLGLLLFLSPWKLPEPAYIAVSSLGDLNTPLAMIVLGGFLAQTNFKEIFKNLSFYKICLIKLFLVPCILFFIFLWIPMPHEIKIVASICAVTPSATAVPMFAEICGKDARYASGAVMINSVFAAVTIPIMLTVAKMVLGF